MKRAVYMLGYADIQRLRRAAQEYGAGRAELAAIDRLDEFRAEVVDLDRLEPLARLAGVDLPPGVES